MATMNISLPEPMKDWVQAQIDEGKYASSSDYVRDLIRKDHETKQKQTALQAAITAGMQSAEAGALDMEAIKQRAREIAALQSF
jgi:antitoxin ParD1/3/4